ncbi:phosphoribosyltransferase family protein [Temperatibacter marinus]|uniref:Phosphoribosyltransferase family protein n=1 Tax=Temperatibacter marinus TaxID=1456591 RepID=A0AA52H9G0_9PROT|nr:phosphoribosyltransferase family protein [Temperatibacter marinus]WND03156.1 phosphoribosyltransferase family protein [Temperatibacter marinus]
MSDIQKVYISAQELLDMSFKLGLNILESGFKPKFIVGVWRGGTPTGIAVQEVMEYYGLKTDHISIRTSSYVGMQQQKEVHVHGLEYIINNINSEDSLLIVDDVFDSGRSVEALIQQLRHTCRKNTPEVIKVATCYYKPAKNVTSLTPDFYIEETDDWLVFPHELVGCSREEIKESKGIDLPEINI